MKQNLRFIGHLRDYEVLLIFSRMCLPGWDRVEVFENLAATMVLSVVLVDTSMLCIEQIEKAHYRTYIQ